MQTQIRVLLHLLWIQICCELRMKVEQSPGVLILQEGRNASMMCNYSIAVTSVQWFQQNHEGHLTSLLYIVSGMKQKGRLKFTVDTKERNSHLYITDSQPGDSVTYFCAVEAQCSPDTCSLENRGGAEPPCFISMSKKALISLISLLHLSSLHWYRQNPFSNIFKWGTEREEKKQRTMISMKDMKSFLHPRPETQPPTSMLWRHRASHLKPKVWLKSPHPAT
uniref:Ig-like domain-containing protein n=2 Tax=Canis lupus TaxID=9612 RepID=A0A8I3MKW9_CANLF